MAILWDHSRSGDTVFIDEMGDASDTYTLVDVLSYVLPDPHRAVSMTCCRWLR